ncbi:serine/threonine-protein kinase [Streptomyces celluloflavus]|uniref:Serine/threonine-protein kinase n=1 Tax=Streptomyces celluloflavus TaxID=58344 RepID=A0ABW7RNK2_9ACTN
MQQPIHEGQLGRPGQVWLPGGPAPLGARDPQRIGEYRLIGRLGEGGMGQVFLARSDRGRTAAVKLVREELAGQEEFRARFRQEVRAALRIGGEWIAPVLDADTEAGTPWVATGYIAGPSLRQVVGGDGTPLPERTVRILAAGLARALESIHAAGIIHRDLKPSNILITIDGPRVIDFGIARALEAAAGPGTTRTGAALGSPGFMAPEQVRGEPLTPACDVFCLGSVLAYAATGQLPFATAGNAAHAVMYRIAQEEPDLTGLPEGLYDLVTACLAKDPAQRPTPAQLRERAEAAGQAAGDADEPWLPAALIARLGRHAVELLAAETPPYGADGGGARPAPPAAPRTADGPDAPHPADRGPERTAEPGRPHGSSSSATGTGPNQSTGQSGPEAPGAHPTPTAAAPALAPPAAPEPAPGAVPVPAARKPRRRRGGAALMTAYALVLAVAGAGAAYAVLSTQGRTGSQAGQSDAGGGEPAGGHGKQAAAPSPSGNGRLPEDYLGTWEATVGSGTSDVRRLTLSQGGPGDTVLAMTATGPAYHCAFTAALASAGPPVRLKPSTVVSGTPATCRPGAPSTLELVDGALRRTSDDGKGPLTYHRTG